VAKTRRLAQAALPVTTLLPWACVRRTFGARICGHRSGKRV
jgi:hypothetical protein